MSDEERDRRRHEDFEQLRQSVRALERLANNVPDRFAEEFAALRVTVLNLSEDVHDLKTALEDKMISRMEFDPVKRIVYGLVGLLLTSIVLAGLGLLLRSRG